MSFIKTNNAPPYNLLDIKTFDDELIALLDKGKNIILAYLNAEREKSAAFEAAPENMKTIVKLSPNPHWDEYDNLVNNMIANLLHSRSILAYHYTRLTDDEVDYIHEHGFEPSTPQSLQRRLNARALAGDLDLAVAEKIYRLSPLQLKANGREGLFWMTAVAKPTNDGEVEALLGFWGGEVSYMPHLDVSTHVPKIGRSRVFEISLPLNVAKQVSSAAKTIVSTYLRSLGLSAGISDFDISTGTALPPNVIVRVLTEGEPEFLELGRQYRDLEETLESLNCT